MSDLVSIKAKLSTFGDLQKIVTSMKNLSLASITQYEKSLTAINSYQDTILLGLSGLMHKFSYHTLRNTLAHQQNQKKIIIAIGSDIGLCGHFNKIIAAMVLEVIKNSKTKTKVLVLGNRLADYLQEYDVSNVINITLPAAIDNISDTTDEIIMHLGKLQEKENYTTSMCIYNLNKNKVEYVPTTEQIYPISQEQLQSLCQKKWPTNKIPMTYDSDKNNLKAIFREYIAITIYRAIVNSLTSEHISRAQTMQNAEKNINEKLAEMQLDYNQTRQTQITSQLLEVVFGALAVE